MQTITLHFVICRLWIRHSSNTCWSDIMHFYLSSWDSHYITRVEVCWRFNGQTCQRACNKVWKQTFQKSASGKSRNKERCDPLFPDGDIYCGKWPVSYDYTRLDFCWKCVFLVRYADYNRFWWLRSRETKVPLGTTHQKRFFPYAHDYLCNDWLMCCFKRNQFRHGGYGGIEVPSCLSHVCL